MGFNQSNLSVVLWHLSLSLSLSLYTHTHTRARTRTHTHTHTHTHTYMGRRVIGISGSLILSKTLMELIFNSCCEFLWSQEGPISQIHSRHLLVGTPGIFSDLLRFVQVLKWEWGAESNGKLPHLFISSKTQPRFLSLQWKTCLWAELQPWCLSLQWRTCPWAEHSDDDAYKKLNYSSKWRPSDSMVLSHLSAMFIISRHYQSMFFDAKNSVRSISTTSIFSKLLPR